MSFMPVVLCFDELNVLLNDIIWTVAGGFGALMFCYYISRLLIIYNRSYLVFPGLELGNLISIAYAMSIITCFALLGTWIFFFLECHTSEIQDETLF